MRRKLFCVTLVLVAMLYFIDFAGINLAADPFEKFKGEEHFYRGRVIRVSRGTECLKLEVDIESCDGIPVKTSSTVLLNYYADADKPWELYNADIVFKTAIENPQGRRNPHCFDYRKYLKSRKIFAAGTLEDYDKEESRLSMIEKYQRWLYKRRCIFEDTLNPDTKGLITGVLFGDTSYMADEEYESFRNNGTAHILAVSGLHIGIIYGLYKKIAGRRNNPLLLLLLCFMLFSYGTLSMWSPSTVRAEIMVILSIVARLADLRYDMLTALSTAALILISWNPYVIFGAGFQMSFLAIMSIVFIRPVLPACVPEFMAVSLAVTAGLLPYQIYQFNYISLVAPLANIPMVFLTGYFVPVAFLYFLESMLHDGFFLAKPVADGMVFMIRRLNELSSAGGYSSVEVASPSFLLAAGIGVMIFFLCSESFSLMIMRKDYRHFARYISSIILSIFIAAGGVYSPQSSDEIVFVDVGQGDCIHLRDGRTDILIDGGGNINYNIGSGTLKPYLLKNGSADVDYALLTHRHTDHFKGIEELDQVFEIKELYSELTCGQVLKVSNNITIETLWPEYIPEDGQEENAFCSVFMIYYGNYKILITGDIDETGERQLAAKYEGTGKLKCDILKIAHHGSAYSSCQEFLDAADPEFAVIQCGKNNYGHPAPKTIEKCLKKGIIVYRNDENGAVSFSLGKRKIRPHIMIEQ